MPKPRYEDDQRALSFKCPACGSAPNVKCTQPTDNAQRPVNWIHYARTELLEKQLNTVTP